MTAEGQGEPEKTRKMSRRSFVVGVGTGVLVGALAVAGVESALTSKSPTSVATSTVAGPTSTVTSTVTITETSIVTDTVTSTETSTERLAIFSDPRLAKLVNSEVTPNDDFYVVYLDIFPSVDVSSWSLAVDGLVNNPKTYSYQDIQALPQNTQYTTLECVGNAVNGSLIGNAKWGGVKLSDLFADVGGLGSGARYVVFFSADSYSVGIPIEKAMMPDTLLAYNMNDQTLPEEHGYPLRSVIPGLYGMMNAKWINEISVVDSVYEGYYQTRGWTNDATINTGTFIVVPESGQASLSENDGSVIIAGFAFAGDRGVSKVEVSFDNGGTWQQAMLKTPLSNLTWVLWAYDWHPLATGQYQVLARATDGSGEVQTSTVAYSFPNGSTGYSSELVQITS
jgi:DMSO/TMAO reductase YedYZ molybdopterin-dependent catalytic subunit